MDGRLGSHPIIEFTSNSSANQEPCAQTRRNRPENKPTPPALGFPKDGRRSLRMQGIKSYKRGF